MLRPTPFDHGDAQRSYEVVRFTRRAENIIQSRTLIVEYDFGLSFDHESPDPDYSFNHLCKAIADYMVSRRDIDDAELRPTNFALSRRD